MLVILKIMKAVQCEMRSSIIYSTKFYTVDDYNTDIFMKNTKTIKQVFETITQNNNFELDENHPLLTTLYPLVMQDKIDLKGFIGYTEKLKSILQSIEDEPLLTTLADFITNVSDKKQTKRFETSL